MISGYDFIIIKKGIGYKEEKILKKNILLILSLVFVLMVSGCSNESVEDTSVENKTDGFKESDKNIVYVGQGFVTADTDPGNGGTGWALTTHGISENLFTVDKNGEIYSRLVESVEREDDGTFKLTLKDGMFFSDGTDLNAVEVSKALNRTNEKNGISRGTVGKIQFEAIDDLIIKITTERPTKIIKSILAEWTNVVYKVKEDETFVFSGPYMIKNLIPNEKLELEPNPYYKDADKRSNVVIKSFKDTSALKLAFESEEIDFAFPVPSEFVEKLKKDGHVIKSLDAGYQYFSFVNLENKILNNLNVRKALNMAIDREELIQALHGGNVPTGVFAHYFPFAGKGTFKYDLEGAKKLLDEEGFKLNKDGMREKKGKKLELKLVTYPQRPDLVTLAHVINSQFKNLGIYVKTEISEDIGNVAKSGAFDIMLYAQYTAPTGEPSFFLNQTFRTNGSKNYGKYSSSELDQKLDELGKAKTEDEVIKVAVEAQHMIMEDLPVFFLVDPIWYVGLSEKVKNYEPWGADYHIIRDELGL